MDKDLNLYINSQSTSPLTSLRFYTLWEKSNSNDSHLQKYNVPTRTDPPLVVSFNRVYFLWCTSYRIFKLIVRHQKYELNQNRHQIFQIKIPIYIVFDLPHLTFYLLYQSIFLCCPVFSPGFNGLGFELRKCLKWMRYNKYFHEKFESIQEGILKCIVKIFKVKLPKGLRDTETVWWEPGRKGFYNPSENVPFTRTL